MLEEKKKKTDMKIIFLLPNVNSSYMEVHMYRYTNKGLMLKTGMKHDFVKKIGKFSNFYFADVILNDFIDLVENVFFVLRQLGTVCLRW